MQASLSTKVAQYQCCPFFNPTQKVIEPKQYKKLNEMLDIKLNGVTYHIYSNFSDGHNLSELLDLVTLEKIERTASDACFKV